MADPPARPSSRSTEPADAIGVIGRCLRADLSLATGSRSDLVCDAAAVRTANLGTLDALARLELAARQHGLSLVVQPAPRGLADLLDLCGLAGLLTRLHSGTDGSIEPGGQTKQRKEALRVEEEHDPGDSIAVELKHLERPRLPPAARCRLVLGEARSPARPDRHEP